MQILICNEYLNVSKDDGIVVTIHTQRSEYDPELLPAVKPGMSDITSMLLQIPIHNEWCNLLNRNNTEVSYHQTQINSGFFSTHRSGVMEKERDQLKTLFS